MGPEGQPGCLVGEEEAGEGEGLDDAEAEEVEEAEEAKRQNAGRDEEMRAAGRSEVSAIVIDLLR